MEKLTIPSGEKFIKDIDSLYKDIEDLKKILSALPPSMLTIENLNHLEEAINPIRMDAITYLKSLEDKPRTYDIFEGGGESKGLCRRLGISERDLYRTIKLLNEIIKFDIKEFVINIKRTD